MISVEHIAHISKDKRIQPLSEHAAGVATLCSQFLATLGDEYDTLAALLGWGHDSGKAQPAFQTYIKAVALEDKDASKAPHSGAGALLFYNALREQAPRLAQLLAYCIDGHHRGLRDYHNLIEILGDAENRKRLDDTRDSGREMIGYLEKHIERHAAKIEAALAEVEDEDKQMLIRFVYSCLVDADFIDTEIFMDEERAESRAEATRNYASMSELRNMLQAHTDRFRPDGLINQKRAKFLATCREHGAKCEKGFYSLFLPTGAGKTLSSMAWALESAIKHQASRIIYAIPYTSIITQTAQIFRDIFGEHNVLEHHSDLDLDDSSGERKEKLNRAKLLSENWDAPIIVTTNVQFFESLFAHKPSRCRKIHNIAGAVLVFDEVQMFPEHLLSPMLRALESLHFGLDTQTLLCSATLPTFDRVIHNEYIKDQDFYPLQEQVLPVVQYNEEDFVPFSRVSYEIVPKELTIDELADELAELESGLCIVNSRGDASKLYEALKERELRTGRLIHLSRMMCSAHIQEVISEIKQRLRDGHPTLIISTQLIEAGVDIDLPIVYRALSGLDSIIQAGGRCNREGKLKGKGRVISFALRDGSRSAGNMTTAQQTTKSLLRTSGTQIDVQDPEVIERYYTEYYSNIEKFDQHNISQMLWHQKDMDKWSFRFEEASNCFSMIDEQGKIDIFVPYKEGQAIIDTLKQQRLPDIRLIRKLQRYRVGISQHQFNELMRAGAIVQLILDQHSGAYIHLLNVDGYSDEVGTATKNPYLDKNLIVSDK